jgi:hypothetical protein
LSGILDDLHCVDPAIMEWVSLSSAADGARAGPRYRHGFAFEGGLLYVHGGLGYSDGARSGNSGTVPIISK